MGSLEVSRPTRPDTGQRLNPGPGLVAPDGLCVLMGQIWGPHLLSQVWTLFSGADVWGPAGQSC